MMLKITYSVTMGLIRKWSALTLSTNTRKSSLKIYLYKRQFTNYWNAQKISEENDIFVIHKFQDI